MGRVDDLLKVLITSILFRVLIPTTIPSTPSSSKRFHAMATHMAIGNALSGSRAASTSRSPPPHRRCSRGALRVSALNLSALPFLNGGKEKREQRKQEVRALAHSRAPLSRPPVLHPP